MNVTAPTTTIRKPTTTTTTTAATTTTENNDNKWESESYNDNNDNDNNNFCSRFHCAALSCVRHIDNFGFLAAPCGMLHGCTVAQLHGCTVTELHSLPLTGHLPNPISSAAHAAFVVNLLPKNQRNQRNQQK